ncbi:MAG: hypothetical protein GYB68_05760 [Chloroflexi bacterium]|nr:hypothetical protein [Chloroflexota bacterium]
MKTRLAFFMLVLSIMACAVPGLSGEAGDPAVEDVGEAPLQAEDTEEGATVDDSAVEPTPEPTDVPPTEVPTETPSICNHTYYPVVEGASWVYESRVNGEEPQQATMSLTDVSDNTFTWNYTLDEVVVSSQWQCSEGGLVQTEYGQVAIGGVGDLELETTAYSGVTLPPIEDFVPGATWQSVYEARATITGQEFLYDITLNYTYVADEEVTVQAGTFTAARIETLISLTTQGTTIEVPTIGWYVEGIGQVRSEGELLDFTSSVELISFNIPE